MTLSEPGKRNSGSIFSFSARLDEGSVGCVPASEGILVPPRADISASVPPRWDSFWVLDVGMVVVWGECGGRGDLWAGDDDVVGEVVLTSVRVCVGSPWGL